MPPYSSDYRKLINTMTMATTSPPPTASSAASSSSLSTLRKSRGLSSRGYVRSGIGGAGNYHKIDPSSLLPWTSARSGSSRSGSAGRGAAGAGPGAGAGVAVASSSASSSSSSAASSLLMDRCKRPFRTGIGGAGNARTADEVAVLSSAELAARALIQREHARSATFHVGVGGTGNWARREAVGSHPAAATTAAAAAAASSPQSSSQASSPLLVPAHKPKLPYSDQPLRVGVADRLAAKLFGFRY